jgi:HAMP domain-containing protein
MTILEKGCLLHLSVSSWTGVAKISNTQIEVHADKDLIKASKFLVDKENLKPIEQIRNESRNYMYSKSLPFPIPGVAFIPKDSIAEVNTQMMGYMQKFNTAVEEFAVHYDSFIEVAKGGLRELFNENDYPPDIRSKFNFQWIFLTVGEANPNTLAPELYDLEKEKFLHTVESFANDAVNLLRNEFSKMVDNLATRLKEGKKFKEASISNLKGFMDEFKNLNIADDAELAILIDKTQQVLADVSGEGLRSNAELKNSVVMSLSNVQKEFDQMTKGRAVIL